MSEAAAPSRPRWWPLVALALLLCFVFGYSPRFEILSSNLDAGYRYEIAAAAVNGAAWGRDIVTTYGPLGHVIYGAVDLGSLPAAAALWQLVLVAGTGIALAAYVRSFALRSARTEAALLAGLALLVHVQSGGFSDDWRWFTLFMLAALLSVHADRVAAPGAAPDAARCSADPAALAASGAAGALAGFLLLAKFSTGLGAVLTLAAITPLRRGLRPAAQHVAAWGAATGVVFAVGWGLTGGSFDGVAEYVRTSMSLADGFSSAMSKATRRTPLAIATLSTAYASLAFVAWSTSPARPFRTVCVCAVPLFLIWKQVMVRSDEWHVRAPTSFLLLLCCVVAIECLRTVMPRRRVLPLLPAAAMLLLLLRAATIPATIAMSQQTGPFRLPGPRAAWSALHLDDVRRDLAARSRVALGGSVLPEVQRAVIGNRAVDVYPWGVDIVAANGLEARPRPMRVSMAAYTPALDDVDAEFYRSARRPDVVLWNNELGAVGLDVRNALWDEPHTFLEILDRYRPVSDGRVLVLESSTDRRFSGRERGPTVTAPWGAWIDAPEAPGPWLAVVDLPRPLTARIRRTLLREEPARISVRTSDREEAFRFAPDLAGQGLWMSPLPTTAAEVRELFEGRLDAPTKAIRFSGAWGTDAAPPITVTWWRLVPSQRR